MRLKKIISVFLLFLHFLSYALSEENAALTIGGKAVSFTEANIYIINAEKEYESVSKYYKDYLGVDYWSLTYANGMTVSQMVKSDVFKELLMMNVFYAMAQEKHFRLSALEKAACKEKAQRKRESCHQYADQTGE